MGSRCNDFWMEIRALGYVCPQPKPWKSFWDSLPAKEQLGSKWCPSLPLILDGWHYSTVFDKITRFREHVEWAFNHDGGDDAETFLRSLTKEDWYSE